MPLHDRKRELALLDQLYARPGGQLIVLYERRRVGKTALLTYWLDSHQHPALFWTADRTSAGAQLRAFSQAIQNYLEPDQSLPANFTYGNWETVEPAGPPGGPGPRLLVAEPGSNRRRPGRGLKRAARAEAGGPADDRQGARDDLARPGM